jgi:hypothetical protein
MSHYKPILSSGQVQSFWAKFVSEIFDHVLTPSYIQTIGCTRKNQLYRECITILEKEVDHYIRITDPVTLLYHQLWFTKEWGSFCLTYYTNRCIVELESLPESILDYWKERMDQLYAIDGLDVLYDLYTTIQKDNYSENYKADLTLDSMHYMLERTLPRLIQILNSRIHLNDYPHRKRKYTK